MGREMRLELTTFGTTIRRSNQLSYTRHRDIELIYRALNVMSTVIFQRFLFFAQKKVFLEIFPVLWLV